MVTNYSDFISALLYAGFSMGGGNDEGIYSVINWSWNESPPYDTPVRWHTGDADTDPWEWRMRVLEERDDIAYAKLFFKKSGYITKQWYPYFLAARRKGLAFAEAYADGTVSHEAKRIYDAIADQGATPLHALKTLSGLSGKENKSRFDRGLTELQTRMFITMCARQQKRSQTGEAYGWYSTVFSTVEQYFGKDVMQKVAVLKPEEATDAIRQQILRINPKADTKKIKKFIYG